MVSVHARAKRLLHVAVYWRVWVYKVPWDYYSVYWRRVDCRRSQVRLPGWPHFSSAFSVIEFGPHLELLVVWAAMGKTRDLFVFLSVSRFETSGRGGWRCRLWYPPLTWHLYEQVFFCSFYDWNLVITYIPNGKSYPLFSRISLKFGIINMEKS